MTDMTYCIWVTIGVKGWTNVIEGCDCEGASMNPDEEPFGMVFKL